VSAAVGTELAPRPDGRGVGQRVAMRSPSGMQKAALVVMNLSIERAAAVLRGFSPEEADEIIGEMARIRSADGHAAEAAVREFYERAMNGGPAGRSGKEAATELIQASFESDRAADLLGRIQAPEASASFAFLEAVDPGLIARLLAPESPETVAFVLLQLGPSLAARILMRAEPARKLDIAQGIASIGTPVPEAGAIVADVLKQRLRAAQTSGADASESDESVPTVRVQPLVDIMNHAEPADEEELLAALRDRDEGLADEVRSRMLVFEDLPKLLDRDLQEVLRGADARTIALALKGAPEAVAEVVLANLSERNREALAEESEELGRVPRSQVEEARHTIVRAVRAFAGTTGLELRPSASAAEPDGAEGEVDYVE
jgi:flagellar motor switch protein FliG